MNVVAKPVVNDHGPLTTDTSTLTLGILGERLAHEREMRQTHDAYEKEIRTLGQEHEKETRELVHNLEGVAETVRAGVIRDRLDALNHERERQERDRSSFATRSETTLSLESAKTERQARIDLLAAAIEVNTKAIKELQLSDREQFGRGLGRQTITSFLAPNLQSVFTLVLAAIALYLALTKGAP